MNATLTVLAKELLDGFRERRAIFAGLIFGPLFGPALFSGLIAFSVERNLDEGEEAVPVEVVGAATAPRLMAHLKQHLIEPAQTYDTRAALRAAVRASEVKLGLVVADDFGEALAAGAPARVWLVLDSTNQSAATAVARTRAALRSYGQTIAVIRLQARGIDPTLALPLAVHTDDTATPSGRAILILGMMTYFLLFATLMGGMNLATDGTAGERERGSLEPLLTLPVPRHVLVLGKLLATTTFMSISLALSITAFAVSVQFLPLDRIGMSTALDPQAALLIFLLLLPFAVLGAGLMTLVASFTRTYREAQSWTSMAMLAPTLPIIFAALNPLQPSMTLMLVPSLAQHLLITELIKGEPVAAAMAALASMATLALAALFAGLVIWRYRSERILG